MTAGMYEIHPALEPVVSAAGKHAIRMGTAAEVANGTILSATEDGVTLSITAVSENKTWVVGKARYELSEGMLDITGLMEVFAAVIEGLPLQEAADHGTIHTCDRLRQNIPLPLVKGIHTPASMGTAFRRCDRLIRDIVAQFRTAIGDSDIRNFWNPPLSRGWRLNSTKQQLSILQLIAGEFCAANAFAAGSILVARIEKTRRVIVGFDEGFDAARKPGVLMRLERRVRATTGERLEIHTEELTDNNRIRRLKTA